MHHGGIVNLITFFKLLGWGGVWHVVNNAMTDSNGHAGKAYGWRRWEQWCVGFDMEVGQIFSYLNGKDGGSQVTTIVNVIKKWKPFTRSGAINTSKTHERKQMIS